MDINKWDDLEKFEFTNKKVRKIKMNNYSGPMAIYNEELESLTYPKWLAVGLVSTSLLCLVQIGFQLLRWVLT